MFKINFYGNNRIWGALIPVSYVPGRTPGEALHNLLHTLLSPARCAP